MNSTTDTPEKLPPCALRLYQVFSQVSDPRQKRGVRYPVAVLLTIIILAKLCGETELRGIAQWAQYRAAPLAAAFALKRIAMPHWTTFSRVLSQLDETAVQQVIQGHLNRAELEELQLILDGKTLRGTIPTGQRQGQHLLGLYAPDSRLVLVQTAVDRKENEIVVAPQVLEQAALQGKVVTGDAMFTQRALSQQIIDAGGDYVWTVKENQPRLYQIIERLFTPERLRPGHGRLQTDFHTASQGQQGAWALRTPDADQQQPVAGLQRLAQYAPSLSPRTAAPMHREASHDRSGLWHYQFRGANGLARALIAPGPSSLGD